MKLRFPRLRMRCPVAYSGDYHFGKGTVVNVSERGWRVQSHGHPVPRGTTLTLSISLPDRKGPLKVDLAVVRWSRGPEFGLEFVWMQPEAHVRLNGFFKSRHVGPIR